MTSEFAIGVHALVYLSHKQSVLSSEALAENVCTNPARIRKVMAKLKKGKLVETKEGLHGGYAIAKEGKDISLAAIADTVGSDFVKSAWKTGNEDMDCLVASGMAQVMDDIYGEMNAKCRKYLEELTIQDIERRIFKTSSEGKDS